MDSGTDESADRPQPAPGVDAGAPNPGTTESEQASAPPESDFGPPVSEFGPSLNDFGPPISVFGSGADTFGPPSSDFGAPLNDFGPPTGEYGPVTGEYPPANGFSAPETAAPGWAPAVPASPELAWRPADAPPTTPGTDYLAPDSSTPPGGQYPADALYGNGFDESVEETVRFNTEPPPAPKRSSGWATGGGIKTDHAGRESAWLRAAESGMPPATEPVAPQQESLSWADDPIAKMLMPKKSEPAKESLSWSDDPIAQRLAPKVVAPQRKKKKSKMPIAIGGGAVALIVVAGLVVVALTRGGGGSTDADQQAAPAVPGSITTAAPTTVAALSCPAKREGPLTIGNGPGGTDTGADAILGFQHAFYSDRNGGKARSFVAPDAANVSPAETIQQAINEVIPKGTSYCLRITETGPDAYDADLTEHRPDGTTTVYRQRIVTVNKDGKHLIFAIDER